MKKESILYKYFPYKTMDHKKILLYGFHFNFMLIFFLAVGRDLYFHNFFNSLINFSAFSMTIFSYYLLHYKKKVNLSSNIIITVAIIPLYILIFFNHFENLVIVYVIFLPLAAFFLLEFKKAIIVNILMYILLICMLYYIYLTNPNVPILNNSLALINIVLASILILVFGVFYHLAIDVSLCELIQSNKQKDILLKEVHHRVKNNLNVISSILGLQALGKNDETKEELSRSKSRIESIAIVHEMLYKQEDFGKIVFCDYVEKLKFLVLSMNTYNNDIEVIVLKNSNTLILNTMIQFGLIINEMLTNSIKYAKHSKKLKIFISLEKNDVDDTYLFHYHDNGEKMLDERILNSNLGLGFKLIHLSVKQLDGTLNKYYNNGLHYKIRFENV